ncbi:MAG: cytochrome c biogenesis CcdA family protein [Casimicrobiaceae bacterium]
MVPVNAQDIESLLAHKLEMVSWFRVFAAPRSTMILGPVSYGLGFMAGALSVLSPCVLPLVPIVAGAAASAHPRGIAALATGLALSFTTVGLFVATVGFAIGLDADWFRNLGAVLLVAFGVMLVSTSLRQRFTASTASIGAAADQWLRRMSIGGLGGQFVIGLLLGLVWAPCVGPTLGAAAVLASEGKDFPQVVLVMALFGIGAALPDGCHGYRFAQVDEPRTWKPGARREVRKIRTGSIHDRLGGH